MTLKAKDEHGNEVAPKVGDRFVRLNRGSQHEPFHGEITAVFDNYIEVVGGGYLGGMHYGKWWGEFHSLEHVTILSNILESKTHSTEAGSP